MNLSMIDKLVFLIRVIVIIIVLVIWSVIGFLFWIPLLIKMIGYFSSMITISTFRNIDIRHAQNRLNFSIQFYIIGYVKILDILKRKKFDELKLEDNFPINIWDLFISIIWDILWTLLFWGFLLFVFTMRFLK